MATVELSVRPIADLSCEVVFKEGVVEQLSAEMKAAVENGVHGSYLQGEKKHVRSRTLNKTNRSSSRQRPLSLQVRC